MLFTDPKSRMKFVMEQGQYDNSPAQSDSTYAWTRGVQRYARYEPGHPLKVESRPFTIMEAFEDTVLPSKYRDLIEEFQEEEVDEEELVQQQLASGVRGAESRLGGLGPDATEEERQQALQGQDPAITGRLRELETLIPSNTPNRAELIQSLLAEFIRERISQGLNRPTRQPNQGIPDGPQSSKRADARNASLDGEGATAGAGAGSE